jgi:archaemetzincin
VPKVRFGRVIAALALGAAVGAAIVAAMPRPTREEILRAERLEPRFEALKGLHAPKTPPRPGEWLTEHEEAGQSFQDFVAASPPRATSARRTLYLQPIGEIGGAHKAILELTADYTSRFFGLPVKMLEPIPLSAIPASAQRVHPSWGMRQLLAPYLLEEVLAPRKPADAVALLGLTAMDLYPEPSWNFVFGAAEPDLSVGVWSIYRNGDPEASPEERRSCLRRTLATATHEIGHLLGIDHCLAWECQMNGANHRAEADSRPLEICPVCQQKLAWITGVDPLTRARRLAEITNAQGLAADARFFEREALLLGR